MKKIVAFSARPDEAKAFEVFAKELALDIKFVAGSLNLDTVHETEGYEAITILGNDDASSTVIEKLAENGVKFIASRSAGFNNIDIEACKNHGIKASNASYSPNCVADFTVMLLLMSMRNYKRIALRGQANDFSLPGNQGRELHNLTVGVIGTGRIGGAVVKNLSGFGCKIIGYDMYENEELTSMLTYVDLETLISESDVITLHAPLFDENIHMINEETISKMKDDVIIINASRGELIDTAALINGLKSGKIASAGLDVLENELGIFHSDRRMDTINQDEFAILSSMPNVILTPHIAFYTDQAVSDMVEVALRALTSFMTTGESDAEVTK